MSLCRLMVYDFTEDTGRYEPDLPDDHPDARLYSDGDLIFGAYYATDLIDQGYVTEPFYGFNLAGFAYWCCQQLEEIVDA